MSTATREPGQSQASADALADYMEACGRSSQARYEVSRLERQLREARKAVKAAQAAEDAALTAYTATPYSDAQAAETHPANVLT